MMSNNTKLSRPTRVRTEIGMALVAVSFFVLGLLAGNARAAETTMTSESSSRADVWKSAFSPGAKPPATARVSKCVVSRFYDGRQVEFTARMSTFTDTPGVSQTMQIKFEVFRRLVEQRGFKKVKGTGLGTWLQASDPAATVYVRELALQGIETSARYKARVSYRWLDATGKVEWKRSRTTKPCYQRVGLPKLAVVTAKHQPLPGQPNSIYLVTVSNTGRSEALNVPVAVSADGSPFSLGLISTIAPGQTVDISVQAATCRASAAVVIDPSRTVRQRSKARPVAQVGC